MKILIVKTSSLGDLIHTFPVITFLRKYFGEKLESLDWVVEKPFSELLTAHPGLDEVFTVDTKKWRKGWFKKGNKGEIKQSLAKIRSKKYDYIFDFQGNVKSGLITYLADGVEKIGFGFRTVPEKLNLLATNKRYNYPKGGNIRFDALSLVKQHFNAKETQDVRDIQDGQGSLKISPEEYLKVENVLEKIKIDIKTSINNSKSIMVCLGANWTNKRLPIVTLIDFLKKIQQHSGCHFVLIWGTAQEKQQAIQVYASLKSATVIDRLKLPTLQNLMGKMDLVIAMDSLPLHLAGETNTPTFSIFGPSSSKKYQPLGVSHHSFQGKCPYAQVFEKRCSKLRSCKSGACVKNATVNELFESFSF